jgi:hypothetical protein
VREQRAEGQKIMMNIELPTSNIQHRIIGWETMRRGNVGKGSGKTTEGETRRAGDGEKEKIKDEHRTLNAQHRTSNKMKGAWKIDTEKANDGGGEEERGTERIEH